MKRFYSLIVVFTILSLSLFGQEVSFSVKAPRLVVVGEPFSVEFVIDNSKEPDEFTPPSFDGFNVIAGPTSSLGQNLTIINNKMSRSETFTYSYVLASNNDGNLSIKPATIKIGSKSYSTKDFPIEVVRESGSESGNANKAGNATNSNGQKIAKDDILLRVLASKSKVYKGESLVVKIKLYTRASLVGIEGAKEPAFNGFWKQELPVDENVGWERETFNGKVYETRVVREYLLFPQKSGVLEIEQMDMNMVAQVMGESSTAKGGSLFDSFFGGMAQAQTVKCKIVSSPVRITVNNLPSGAPASFDGAVGEFNITGTLANDKIDANSSTQLTLQISGQGNMPLVNAPKPKFPDTFELYNAKTQDDYKTTATGVTGTKRFEYPFIPRAEGSYEIPPVEFSYFDTKSESYKTVATTGFNIEVLRDNSSNSGTSGVSVVQGVTKEELKILNNDIRFIKIDEHKLRPKNNFFIWSLWYIVVIVALVLIFFFVLIYMQKRIKELRDSVRLKNKKANKKARLYLKSAHKYMGQQKENLFYEHVLKALLGYVSDKLNIPVAHLSKDNMRDQLVQKGASTDDVNELLNIISECEFAQYAPGKGVPMANVYNSSLDLIGRFESKL